MSKFDRWSCHVCGVLNDRSRGSCRDCGVPRCSEAVVSQPVVSTEGQGLAATEPVTRDNWQEFFTGDWRQPEIVAQFLLRDNDPQGATYYLVRSWPNRHHKHVTTYRIITQQIGNEIKSDKWRICKPDPDSILFDRVLEVLADQTGVHQSPALNSQVLLPSPVDPENVISEAKDDPEAFGKEVKATKSELELAELVEKLRGLDKAMRRKADEYREEATVRGSMFCRTLRNYADAIFDLIPERVE